MDSQRRGIPRHRAVAGPGVHNYRWTGLCAWYHARAGAGPCSWGGVSVGKNYSRIIEYSRIILNKIE